MIRAASFQFKRTNLVPFPPMPAAPDDTLPVMTSYFTDHLLCPDQLSNGDVSARSICTGEEEVGNDGLAPRSFI